MEFIFLILAGLFVGWNIGANDAANCIGTVTGSGIIRYRYAIWLVAAFVILGSVLQGHFVTQTFGTKIVNIGLSFDTIFISMLSAGILVAAATIFKMPVSTTQAIIGGIIGSVSASTGYCMDHFNTTTLLAILLGWVTGPFLCLTGAIAFHIFLKTILKCLIRMIPAKMLENLMALIVLFSSCYCAYALGANNTGNAFGPVLNRYPNLLSFWVFLGGISIAAGALTFGKRVTKTISNDIIPLDMLSAFSAQFSTALVVHIFALLAIPISTSQGIVGSLAGIGIVNNIKTIKGRILAGIFISWFAVPITAGITSFAIQSFWNTIAG